MYDRFKELGVPVRLTRDTDISLSPKERTAKAQSFFGNGKDVIVVSNHLNAGGGDGAEVIYALRNKSTLSKKVLDEIEKEGQNARKYYQLRLPSNPIKDYYFMHRDTPNNETIIVEYGFVDSNKDDVEQIKNNYKRYAEAVVRAVLDYKGIKYVPTDSNYYIVKKGDSLWSIANKFGTTVKKLKEINKLSTNILSVGQTLIINNEEEIIPDDYLLYKVQKGDTLWDIANKYNTTVDTIKSINNLSSTSLTVNQQLFIPKNTNMGVKNNIYVVQKGDTLYDIALAKGVSVKEIKDINNLTSDVLQIGQILNIPRPSSGEINYVVQKGDNLYSIANKYDITIDDIKKLNNLSTNILQIGQVLKIPGSTNYNTYVVKKGDNLWDIANKYGTTVKKLMTINNLDTTLLKVGQSLIIPTD